ncbi:HIRAN domain-containing protein [Sphingobium sp. WCS2017Hpa-17]|uniref:HIRAN domain-containing protein n=1 Tax=Sphingobium sp. WCS2017Hpa-17 TaxID=3073638 RepID=UPI00288A0618|nr:HIRAN domain-containing protein [Sphingobium sp. WCS2017Hpa-17]
MRHLSLAVVGADHHNKSGPTRRFEIAMCSPGEPVELRHEPKNPADSNAIAVYSARGIQIGYVRAERAPLVLLAMGRAGASAIFQQKERWGATIRAHLDGSEPVLPPIADSRAADWPPPGSEDAGWWPDEIYPDE